MSRNAAQDHPNQLKQQQWMNDNNQPQRRRSQDPPTGAAQEEISNISAGVFRRDSHNNHQFVAPVHLNEYFARNLNMAKLNHHGFPGQNNSKVMGQQLRSSSSSLRQILPIALCLFTFASILSMLLIYIDTTEIRHQQFRLNMSRDYELLDVSQDDPVLITYLREMHLKKYLQEPMFNQDVDEVVQVQRGEGEEQISSSSSFVSTSKFASEMAENALKDLFPDRAERGTFIQSSIGMASDGLMIAPYLVEKHQWRGLIVEPDPKKFFNYGKAYAKKRDVHVIHACFSPTGYPKEVTLHQDQAVGGVQRGHAEEEEEVVQEVKISSVLDGEEEAASDWFENRVKCFSLFTLMLAVNQTEVDLLSLSLHGLELQILKTLPFARVRVDVISLHFANGEDERKSYIQTVTRFLTAKGFKLMKVVGHNYFYKNKRGLKRAPGV